MKNNSKITIVLTSIAAGVLAASLSTAGVGNVSNTNHNFSLGGVSPQNKSSVINQVCVFCHTPHNAGPKGPLWNKASSTAVITYKFYSSSTLSSVANAAALTNNSPSLLCLGCHDGKTAMNVLHSSGTGSDASLDGYPAGSRYAEGNLPITMSGPVLDIWGDALGPSYNLGRAADGTNDTQGDNLADDHPIGFSYDSAQQLKPAALITIGLVDSRIRFSGALKKVECTTCHDPHVDTSNQPGGNTALKPFLVMSNSGSGLCLSCHIK